MSSFLGHPVDIPCRSFVDLKSNKSSMKLIEFLNPLKLFGFTEWKEVR